MIDKKQDVTPQNLARELEEIRQRMNVEDLEDHKIFPKYFQFETSRACNARCTYCPINDWDKTVAYMPDALFSKVVDELKQYADWVNTVCISRAGEPLLDQKLPQRVRMLKEAGIKFVTLTTNVSLLSEAKTRALIDAGLDEIMFSFDSIEKETFEKIRVGLKFDKVMANVQTFFRIREELNAKTRVRVRGVSFYDLNKPEDRQQLEAWESFWRSHCRPDDRIYMKKAHNWGNQFTSVKLEHEEDVYHPCILPWSTMHITTMGIIALCCQDYDAKYHMGDVNTNTIAEIWNNEKWKNVRQLHSTGQRNEMEMCRGCRLFDLDHRLEKSQQKQLVEG